MCWEHQNEAGILLQDIYFTTPGGLERKVLKEVSLAQIHVAYDDGSLRVFHIADYGLGGSNLQNMASSQCQNGQLLTVGASNALCRRVEDRGYVYKDYSEKVQGQLLNLYSQSNTDGYTWLVRWQFYDDGTIEPMVGATGSLNKFGSNPNYGDAVGTSGAVAIASAINYFWRLDFDIAGNGANDLVEEFNISPTNSGSEKSLAVSSLTSETGRVVDRQLKRSWRVRDSSVNNSDGHPVSYHLEALHAGYNYSGRSDEAWAQSDIYVTQYDSCERFIANNPTTNGCADSITGFLDNQNTNGADIVIWYGLTYHHFPRDEDQPYMPTRWDGFQIVPRDWTATSSIAFTNLVNWLIASNLEY
jgi:primary-amine oxidase